MTQAGNQHPLSENELDRLEDLLGSAIFADQAMRLDEIQGAFCAMASGPEPVAAEIWLPAVLGVEPGFAFAGEAAEVAALLERYYAETAAALVAGEAPRLLFYPASEAGDELDYAAWADGYLYGTELCVTAWNDAAGEHGDDLAELLDVMYFIDNADEEVDGPAGRKALERAVEGLPDLLVAIHDFWRAKLTPVATLRRDAPKVGRNDPCPCGSGRKFKQCCGDPKRLH